MNGHHIWTQSSARSLQHTRNRTSTVKSDIDQSDENSQSSEQKNILFFSPNFLEQWKLKKKKKNSGAHSSRTTGFREKGVRFFDLFVFLIITFSFLVPPLCVTAVHPSPSSPFGGGCPPYNFNATSAAAIKRKCRCSPRELASDAAYRRPHPKLNSSRMWSVSSQEADTDHATLVVIEQANIRACLNRKYFPVWHNFNISIDFGVHVRSRFQHGGGSASSVKKCFSFF